MKWVCFRSDNNFVKAVEDKNQTHLKKVVTQTSTPGPLHYRTTMPVQTVALDTIYTQVHAHKPQVN